MNAAREPFLVYDGACPRCSLFARKTTFRTPAGLPLTLIDASRAPGLVAELRRQGCDIEEGMILVVDGQLHHGAAAARKLHAMMSGTGWFDRFVRWFSSSPGRIRLVYPWLRRLRSAALRLKRKGQASC